MYLFQLKYGKDIVAKAELRENKLYYQDICIMNMRAPSYFKITDLEVRDNRAHIVGCIKDFAPEEHKKLQIVYGDEQLLFFYPDAYVSGMSNSTLNTSYKPGRTCAYLGARKATALSKDDKGNMGVIDGNKFQLFFTALTDAEVQSGKVGTITLPKNHKCYMVEFNGNSKYDYAVYDYTENKIIYPEAQADAPTTSAKNSGEKKLQNGTEAEGNEIVETEETKSGADAE